MPANPPVISGLLQGTDSGGGEGRVQNRERAQSLRWEGMGKYFLGVWVPPCYFCYG